jgi:hypothetical protein
MKLNFTQKAYLSGTLFYLVLITGMLSVFQPSNSIRTAISEENKSEKVITNEPQFVLDTEHKTNDESIIPFLVSPIEVCFNKFNQKGSNTFTKL